MTDRMAEPTKCSRCGADLPPGAPGGHCPRCLLKLGLGAVAEPGESPAGSSEPPPPGTPRSEGPGDRIGRHRLVRQIGEGGMGVVWLAEQEEPVRRQVALKIVKLGMDTKAVVARFEAERQALALMEHPNITRVFDAGATESGRPYFVMELVAGARITDYCDQHQLAVPERLKLFVQICRAVQHAHQKGILHCDLKPSNILVTEMDGVPVPKVIDFGIAKAITGGPLTDKTLFTAFEQFLGTPAYMSPEQAAMGRLDIDTRSDIYSLGVLAYELLAGRPPFTAAELQRSALNEILKTLREKDPPLPSARLTTLAPAELAEVARRRQSEPRILPRLVRGDLDWIVMKALEKDRDRRYETLSGLARDVERSLANEPVSARPPGRLYLLQKMARRNRAAVGGVLAIFIALVLGLALAVWSLRREQEARRLTESALAMQAQLRAEAEDRARIAQAELMLPSGDYGQAQSLLDKVPPNLLEPDPRLAATYRALALWRASHKQWAEAAENFARLEQTGGLDDSPFSATDCLLGGPVLIASGQTNAYERFREAAAARLTNAAGPAMMQSLCRACLLLPADAQLVQRLDRFYEPATLDLNAGSCRSDDGRVCLALALMDYRRGNFAKAVELSRRCLACGNGSGIWDYFVSPSIGDDETNNYSSGAEATGARIILAMAHHQLHQEEDARVDLGYAFEAEDASFPNTTNPSPVGNTNSTGFLDWYGDHILWQEATALVGAPRAPDISNAARAREQLGTTLAEPDCARSQAILDQIPRRLIQLDGSHAGALIFQLGYRQALHGQWQQADSDWGIVLYGPDGAGSLRSGYMLSAMYSRYAPLLLVAGDVAGYEKLRACTLANADRIGNPDDAYPILMNCLLLPVPDPATAIPLRKLAATLSHLRTTYTTWKTRSALTFALLDYRLDNRIGMENWLAASHDYAGCLSMLDLSRVIAALDCCQLGQTAQARSGLALCRDVIESSFAQGRNVGERANDEIWFDWWVNHILVREAEARLAAASAPSAEPAK
jgi:hypothetical protein